jgi:hypothetical protein
MFDSSVKKRFTIEQLDFIIRGSRKCLCAFCRSRNLFYVLMGNEIEDGDEHNLTQHGEPAEDTAVPA